MRIKDMLIKYGNEGERNIVQPRKSATGLGVYTFQGLTIILSLATVSDGSMFQVSKFVLQRKLLNATYNISLRTLC